MKESKLTDNQIRFKQYLERCVLNTGKDISKIINNELYRYVGRVTFELSEVEMNEVVEQWNLL